MEGTSFRSVLEGNKERVRDVLYGVYSGGTKPGIRAVKIPGWKLIKYDTLEGTVRETQMFDLTENPWELLVEHSTDSCIEQTGNRPGEHQQDIAELPDFAAKRVELERLLKDQQRTWGDPYMLWDQ